MKKVILVGQAADDALADVIDRLRQEGIEVIRHVKSVAELEGDALKPEPDLLAEMRDMKVMALECPNDYHMRMAPQKPQTYVHERAGTNKRRQRWRR